VCECQSQGRYSTDRRWRAHDSSSFRVEALNSTQYGALVTLTESYFAAGYEWFTPVALRAADQDNLAKRFAG
jgi:hypothetical protein